jgi:hypothetical protein
MGLIVDVGSEAYAQFAVRAPSFGGSASYVELGPQLHQLVGLYHGAPSAMQVVRMSSGFPSASGAFGLGVAVEWADVWVGGPEEMMLEG